MKDEHFYTYINDRFNRLEDKIDGLTAWRWKQTGAVIAIAFLTSALVAYLR